MKKYIIEYVGDESVLLARVPTKAKTDELAVASVKGLRPAHVNRADVAVVGVFNAKGKVIALGRFHPLPASTPPAKEVTTPAATNPSSADGRES